MIKKIILCLLIIFLVGCSSKNDPVEVPVVSDETEVVEPTPAQIKEELRSKLTQYGELSIERTMGELKFYISPSWSINNLSESTLAVVSGDFQFMFGINENEKAFPLYEGEAKELESVIKQVETENYAFVGLQKIEDRYGYIVDLNEGGSYFRNLNFSGEGKTYFFSFTAYNRKLTPEELTFAYNYFQTIELINE